MILLQQGVAVLITSIFLLAKRLESRALRYSSHAYGAMMERQANAYIRAPKKSNW